MPVSEGRLYEPARLNRWFAASSVLMTVSILWMIAVDYHRPWHRYQDHWFVIKAALGHLEYLQAITEDRQREIEEARQRLADARELDAGINALRRVELNEELEKVSLDFKQADMRWSQLSQLIQVTSDTYERALTAHGPNHPQTIAAREALDRQREQLSQYQQQKEAAEDHKLQLENRLAELNDLVDRAEKELRNLEQAVASAKLVDKNYRGVLYEEGLLADLPLVSAVINAPLLDFTAPKNTPGRRQVNQLVLPDIRQQLNYLETYTTDRCTTCHVAIDDPQFDQERLATELERALPAINEELVRRGEQPLEFPPVPALKRRGAQPLISGRVTEFWDALTRSQRNEYFDALVAFVNRYLKLSGRKTIELRQPLLAHPMLELFVSVESPHPKARVGCTVCHSGNPQETDFVLAAHTPPTHEIEEEWREKYYDTNLGVPTMTFETMAHYWDRPMHVPEHTQAGCAQCHTDISDVSRYHGERVGERLNLGRHLFKNWGCINCHNVDSLADSRRVGPDLQHVSSKLTPAFVQQWVWSPRDFRPSTLMPHLFQQENNIAESANEYDKNPVLRTHTEVAAISKYLFTVSRPWDSAKKPEGIQGDPQRGRMLFTQVGCLGCHSNLAEYGEEWITKDLMHREGLDEQTATYRYRGMTYEQRVRYAMEHFVDEKDTFLQPEAIPADPENGYVPPTFSRFAPELSGIGSKVNEDWLYAWLKDPTHYSSTTLMPSLRLSDQEAADLAAYLKTLRNDAFVQREFELNAERLSMVDELVFDRLSGQRSAAASRAVMNDEGRELTRTLVSLLRNSLGEQTSEELVGALSLQAKKLVFLGNKMIAHYGCYACHNIPGFETTTPPGTDLTKWAEKPVSQLDFAFYDDAFHHMREEKEEVFGHVYPRHASRLRYWSPVGDAREQITHGHAAFAYHKMLNPRIWDREKIKKPYDKLKMPNYFMTQEEATALTTYLLSRRTELVNGSVKIDYDSTHAGSIARGRDLTRELNCVGCHQIEDNRPAIQQYFRRTVGGREELDLVNSPPLLWGEGAKVQHNWLHQFFAHVEPLRPWLAIRMPTFHLTNEQRTALVEYFAALSQHDSDRLDEWLTAVDEHVMAAQSFTNGAAEGEAGSTYWFEDDAIRPAAENLARFAVERKLVREHTLDPLLVSTERLAGAYQDVLERTRFLQNLYDVEYPFVEPPRPLSSDEHFATGRNFLIDMGCLKCHILGDMLAPPAKTTSEFVNVYRLDGVRGAGEGAAAVLNGRPYPVGSVIDGHTLISAENIYYETGDSETKAVVEGPNEQGEIERIALQAPSAPNLSLTHVRLRRSWVVQWMLQPGWIQPGTKMPQNFMGGKSPYEGDPRYPGTGMDHVNLLVDTLYEAGTRNVRQPLVKTSVSQEGEEFDEGESFFDEEEFD